MQLLWSLDFFYRVKFNLHFLTMLPPTNEAWVQRDPSKSRRPTSCLYRKYFREDLKSGSKKCSTTLLIEDIKYSNYVLLAEVDMIQKIHPHGFDRCAASGVKIESSNDFLN